MTKRLKRVPSALSGLRQAELLKDLREHGNRKRSSGDIRRQPIFISPTRSLRGCAKISDDGAGGHWHAS